MGTNNEEKRDKGQFVQFPLHLIYERKDLSRDDKWVLLSIMGTYWTEGPHRLSYREVAALSGVPLALLTSYLDKKTGKQHEGILDRLARTGDIRITQNKDTNPLTGQPRGQTQSYIWVNYTRLWEQNAAYCETRKSVPNTNASVPYTNTSVSDTNASVPNVNRSVPNTNDSVSVLPSEVPPIDYIDITDKEDTEDKEESTGEQSDATTFAPSLSLDAVPSSSPQSEIETHSQQGDTHGTILPTGDTDLHRPLECTTAPGIAQDASGDTHGTTSTQQQEIARTCDTCGRPQTQADCSWCMTTRLPAIPKQTSSLPSAVEPGRSGGPTPGAPAPLPGGTSHNKKASQVQDRDATPLSDTQSVPASTRTAECEPRLTPSQPGVMTSDGRTKGLSRTYTDGMSSQAVNSGPTDRTTDIFLQEPPKAETDEGEALHGQNRSATPPRSVAVEGDSGCITPASAPQVPPGVAPPRTMRATVVPPPPKWDAQAMLARAEALREKPFSESARPKETKAARKLFARKPDLTEEEFTSAFQHWNTPWWRETNGLFCITDLAAVPKNKSEMRLIIALEKLAMPKKPPGGQVIQMPTTRGQQWRSSFDDPDYDMSAEFYPSESERSKPRAAAK